MCVMYRLFVNFWSLIVCVGVFCGCADDSHRAELLSDLHEIVDAQEATVGVAVIVDGNDTIEVNGSECFPMFSVYKLPISLAYVAYCYENGLRWESYRTVRVDELERGTYSPMLELFGDSASVCLSRSEIVDYAMRLSDNNASDLMLAEIGGTVYVDGYLKALGYGDISVANTEAEMYREHSLCHDNGASAVAMASLLDRFVTEATDSLSMELRGIMESCSTGADRLAAGLGDEAVAFGHKTGSGFTLPDGYDMAVNDAGYVLMANGHRYTIVVFIANKPGITPADASVIARISEVVYRYACSI